MPALTSVLLHSKSSTLKLVLNKSFDELTGTVYKHTVWLVPNRLSCCGWNCITQYASQSCILLLLTATINIVAAMSKTSIWGIFHWTREFLLILSSLSPTELETSPVIYSITYFADVMVDPFWMELNGCNRISLSQLMLWKANLFWSMFHMEWISSDQTTQHGISTARQLEWL